MAKDVTTFLSWTAEPEHDNRKKMGLQVRFFPIRFVLTWLTYLGNPYRRVHDGHLSLCQAIQVDTDQEPKTILQSAQDACGGESVHGGIASLGVEFGLCALCIGHASSISGCCGRV